MTETDRQGVAFRQEALDYYARLDRDDTAPSFKPAAMLPRWWSLLVGVICLVLLGAGGLWYQVDEGPQGMLVDIADDSVIVGFTDTIPDLVGEPIVLAFSNGVRIEGTAVDSRQVTGNGSTGTMLLVELESDGSASGHDGETVTVNPGRTGLLTDIFTDRGGDPS